MNPDTQSPPAAVADDLPVNVPDSETLSKTMVIGFIVGCGFPLSWNAPTGMVLATIRKLAKRALVADALEKQIPLGSNPQSTNNTALENVMNTPDFSTLTPVEAGLLFNSYITELEKTLGLDHDTARLRVKFEKPALFARMTVNDAQALANAGFAALPAEPIFSPQMKSLLKLPTDADSDETTFAWRATKGFTAPPDFKAIYRLMLSLWGGRIRAEDRTADETRITMKLQSRFPELARAVAEES